MRALRWLVLTLVMVAVIAELTAPALVESRIEQRVSQQVQGAVGVDADVGTFPAVSRFLATSRVRRLTITISEVTGRELPFTEVRYAFEGIRLDRDAAFQGDVRVTGVERGRVTAAIALDELATVLGLGGAVEVDVPVEVRDRRLVAAGTTGPAVPEDLLPCAPEATVEEDRVVVSCALDTVPEALIPAGA